MKLSKTVQALALGASIAVAKCDGEIPDRSAVDRVVEMAADQTKEVVERHEKLHAMVEWIKQLVGSDQVFLDAIAKDPDSPVVIIYNDNHPLEYEGEIIPRLQDKFGISIVGSESLDENEEYEDRVGLENLDLYYQVSRLIITYSFLYQMEVALDIEYFESLLLAENIDEENLKKGQKLLENMRKMHERISADCKKWAGYIDVNDDVEMAKITDAELERLNIPREHVVKALDVEREDSEEYFDKITEIIKKVENKVHDERSRRAAENMAKYLQGRKNETAVIIYGSEHYKVILERLMELGDFSVIRLDHEVEEADRHENYN